MLDALVGCGVQDTNHCVGIVPLQPRMQTFRPKLGMGMLADVKAHDIPGQRDVKLNELAKQILMLLPLLLLLYVFTT